MGFHFLFFDQFSPVGLLDAFVHLGAKRGVPLAPLSSERVN